MKKKLVFPFQCKSFWIFNMQTISDSCSSILHYHQLPRLNTVGCSYNAVYYNMLTHWGRVTHICVSKLTIIVSDNGLSPDRRQAIIRTSAGILLIGPLGTNFSEILIEILTFSLKKNAFESVVCKTAVILSRPQCVNAYSTVVLDAEHASKFEFTTDTQYLTVTGKLWGVYWGNLWKNWLHYNGAKL